MNSSTNVPLRWKVVVWVFLLGLLITLFTGCATQPRFETSLTSKFVSPHTVSVENLTSHELLIFQKEDRPIAVVAPGEIVTINVNLEYYEKGFSCVLFAHYTVDSMEGKQAAKARFIFQNQRYPDPAVGREFGPRKPEQKVWVIKDAAFVPSRSDPTWIRTYY